ncbi:MAG: glycoside hydrolase family 3 protein [Acidobacteria bacterium]|nr:glycoside hydrolase family 3 protein [Acidobacteriota bacterium]
MNLAQQLGQVLIVGMNDATWSDSAERFLRHVRPGGVIFFQRNITGAPEFRELVLRVRERLDANPILALDLEGGSVDRLRQVLAPLPAVNDVARAGLGEELGRMAGRELAAFSLNVDFAPVLDLGSPASRGVMGSRTAGATPREVIEFGRSFLRGLQEYGIVGCGKHFPGLGSGQIDSHKEMPVVVKTEREMEEDLEPFRALSSELPMIMVAHVSCPALEAAYGGGREDREPVPATLSSAIISGLLKEKMRFEGVVLGDDLEMGGALQGRTMEQAAAAAIKAGCDALLLCGQQSNTERVFDALLREADTDSAFGALIERAAAKVLILKDRLKILGNLNRATAPADYQKLRDDIATLSALTIKRAEAASIARDHPIAEGEPTT